MPCYIEAGMKFLRYLNIILDNSAFEHTFLVTSQTLIVITTV